MGRFLEEFDLSKKVDLKSRYTVEERKNERGFDEPVLLRDGVSIACGDGGWLVTTESYRDTDCAMLHIFEYEYSLEL